MARHGKPDLTVTLHSIMFLLIPKLPNNFGSIRFLFTFHNVSINTKAWWQKYPNANIFTFHNVSINTIIWGCNYFDYPTLHSIMFLLIPVPNRSICPVGTFTFHNVSINTTKISLCRLSSFLFTFHNVSINTRCF